MRRADAAVVRSRAYRSAFLSLEPERVEEVAILLAGQWPEQGVSSRRSMLLSHVRKPRSSHAQLPCHLLLLENCGESERVVAHCRLQPACESRDGFSAAVTSVVVSRSMRGCGIGSALMLEAESVARIGGYGYLYLWTHDAVGFYTKSGYALCDPVSLMRPVLATLDDSSRSKLESLFAAKARNVARANGQAAEAAVRADSTWMRKRLRELSDSEPFEPAALLRAVGMPHIGAQNSQSEERAFVQYTVPWERQIGPCCGLAALRMARAALRAAESSATSNPPQHPVWGTVELHIPAVSTAAEDASVLEAAIARGFSSDGELFDIHHLAILCAEVCGLHACVLARLDDPLCDQTGGLSDAHATSCCGHSKAPGAAFSEQVVAWLRAGGLVIVPYDKGESSHGPVQRGGNAAHYALLVGAVRSELPSAQDRPQDASGCAGWQIIGLHGLSRSPLLLDPAELEASNAQLLAMKQSGTTASWKVGKAGIRLAHRILLVAG